MIKLLHLSGKISQKIKGVFSGTLSYLFNNFSAKDIPFSEILREAIDSGFTRPKRRFMWERCGKKIIDSTREDGKMNLMK
jgi:hypothetical protein